MRSSTYEVIKLIASLGGILGGFVGILRFVHRPIVQMKFVATAKGYTAMIRRKNCPTNFHFYYKNIDGLTMKGHIVRNINTPKDGNAYNNWCRIASIETQKSFDEFKADCKKDAVHSEITYQYDSFWYREKTKTKKFYWHKQRCDKLA